MDTENTEAANDQTEISTTEIGTDSDEGADTFSREYVEKLRGENAKLRVHAKSADGLGQRLHLALVEQDGRLQDARDLPFQAAHLEDPDALHNAITTLLEDRPTLASRTPKGDVGQGSRGSSEEPVSLLGILKNLV